MSTVVSYLIWPPVIGASEKKWFCAFATGACVHGTWPGTEQRADDNQRTPDVERNKAAYLLLFL